jgi:integrase
MPRRKVTTIEQNVSASEPTKKKPRRANGEGSVRQRSNGRYEVRVSLPDGERRSVYGETRKEVLTKARSLRSEVERGTYVSPSQETLAEHLGQWIQAKRLTWDNNTYVNSRGWAENHILPALGQMQLQQLKTHHIQAFYHDLILKKGLAASTVRGIHSTLRGALEQAFREQKLSKNPAQHVVLPKIEEKEMRYLTGEEVERLIEAANAHKLGCLFIVAAATGMRRNELLALTWEDIDLEQGMIRVRHSLGYHNIDGSGYTYEVEIPKSRGSKRTILLPTFAIEALHQHRVQLLEMRQKAKEWHNLGLAFPNAQGQHRCPNGMYTTYKRFLRKAGIADANFHAIRHGHATNLLEMGENPRVVQERLGHSNVGITLRIYAHVTPTMQQQTVAKLNARFGKETQTKSRN